MAESQAPEDSSPDPAKGEPVKFVRRDEWGAREPTATTPIRQPVGVAFHWNGPGLGVFPHSRCAAKVRAIQNYHMDEKRWADIAYNAIVCPHGYVFEGRGPFNRSAANGDSLSNSKWLAVCWLGGVGDEYTPESRKGLCDALTWLRGAGAGFLVEVHRTFTGSQCPGDEIIEWVRAGCPVDHIPAPVREVGMILVKDPDSNKVWACGNETKRWVTSIPERDLMVRRGVPFADDTEDAVGRRDLLRNLREVPERGKPS